MHHNFIGYGSLMSHNSLKKTIKDKKFTPVIVKGYKRVFDLKENSSDVLNLEKSPKSYFNGIMFSINDKELIKLKEREDDYNLEETKVYDFKTEKSLGIALIVIDYLVNIDKKLLPDKSYFILCREAAYHISEEFGKLWDETTYTSKEEKVSDWIKTNRSYNTIK